MVISASFSFPLWCESYRIRVRVTLQLTVGQSVSQSVRLGVEPLQDSSDFGCGQDSCSFVMGHPPCRGDGSIT
jgi:hypothetical protein